MKRALIGMIVLAAACAPGTDKSGESYDLSATGIEWHKGMEAVAHWGKPILLFQLLGDFDDVYC